MSTYFTLPSFARAKKNKEDLEKTNPQDPVLKDEDEKFLENITSPGEPASEAKDVPPTEITDSGEEKEIPAEEAQADGAGDQLAVPETKPDQSDEKKVEETTERKDEAPEASADDPPEVTPDDDDPAKSASSPAKKKKSKGIELPSQEEAEAATRGFDAQAAAARQQGQDGTKRTWASYLPSVGSTAKRDGSQPNKSETTAKDGRTWAAYASSYVPSSLPSMPSWARSRDAKVEPVYNEDGSVNEEATKEKQEREVSVLLDNLHLSNINNRVFSFSDESRKFYERFTLVLKDVINGAPSAYDDMEKLMKDAGPTLEKQFNSMPPFVQTLVKALPAKLGTTLGPELMAAASEKPGHDGKARMEAASKQANKGGDPSIQPADDKEGDAQQKKKQKKTIPGLKGLVGEQGMAATILRNIVTFLQTRFPFLMTTTNVVMSLAVFSKSRSTTRVPSTSHRANNTAQSLCSSSTTAGSEAGRPGWPWRPRPARKRPKARKPTRSRSLTRTKTRKRRKEMEKMPPLLPRRPPISQPSLPLRSPNHLARILDPPVRRRPPSSTSPNPPKRHRLLKRARTRLLARKRLEAGKDSVDASRWVQIGLTT